MLFGARSSRDVVKRGLNAVSGSEEPQPPPVKTAERGAMLPPEGIAHRIGPRDP